MNNKTIKERIKVLEKLIDAGYDTDKKIMDLKIEDILLLANFSRLELNTAVGIKQALVNKSLVSYLCNNKD